MERVVFSGSWKHILAENGLKKFKDFYRCNRKKCIDKNNRRNVSIILLNTGGEEKTLYMKRFRHSHLKDILFTFLNRGKICSQAYYEWSNLKLLNKNNIGTPERVCFGEQTRLGIERKSFLITEELNGQCLTDFISQNWDKLASSEKEKIIVSLAKTIRKIHKAGISLPDLYIWHIFINKDKNTGEYSFAFIDLNRMKRGIKDKNEKIKNLGRLNHSMTDKYFDKSMRRLLLESYAAKENGTKIEKLIRQVKRYSKKYSARRRVKPY